MTLPDTPFYISGEKAQEALAGAKKGGESEPLPETSEFLFFVTLIHCNHSRLCVTAIFINRYFIELYLLCSRQMALYHPEQLERSHRANTHHHYQQQQQLEEK